jgi:hypothetical protein
MDSTVHWLTTAFDGLVAFFPSLIAGLVILLLGYIVAKVLARVTRLLARRLGLTQLVARLEIGSPDEREKSPEWLGSVVFFLVMVVAFLQASRAWRLELVTGGLAAFMAYVPHVIGAAFILGLALYAGNWARARLVRAGAERVGVTGIIPAAVRGIIIGVGAFMALRELQIAPEIVNAAFIILLGAVGVAGAIAFGLGGRDVAKKITASWYERRGAMPWKKASRSAGADAPAE